MNKNAIALLFVAGKKWDNEVWAPDRLVGHFFDITQAKRNELKTRASLETINHPQ